ncbi:MAG: Purine catabolism protein PucB [Alphaproteobacteria bacterium MarineAlpha2_Bin1]|nr:MAG: Purine catabolism protein PucB [Alphaproteobacteria bacterium MarineAlpha2_Bin1]|tara:strand:+ start:1545 stop:2096 length:552 start_codon:yes stop_codon:yes gene_type:complete
MEGENKLLQKINDEVMIKMVTNEVLKSKVDEVIIVTGHDEKKIIKSLKNLPLKFIKSSNYVHGIGNSISSGIHFLSKRADGVIIILGDMPKITFKHINILVDSFIQNRNESICVLESNKRQGNPVLFGNFFFDQLKVLSNDYGGKDIIHNNLDYIIISSIDDSSIFIDIDTPAELKNLIEKKN